MQTSGISALYNDAQRLVRSPCDCPPGLTPNRILETLENLLPAWGIAEMGANLNRELGEFRKRWRDKQHEPVRPDEVVSAIDAIIRAAVRNPAHLRP